MSQTTDININYIMRNCIKPHSEEIIAFLAFKPPTAIFFNVRLRTKTLIKGINTINPGKVPLPTCLDEAIQYTELMEKV